MDIQHLVDRLEELVDEGKHFPFSKYTLIDEERALELIDQMRISIPEEIEKAARILAQRDRVLAQANEEAARILAAAREKGDRLLEGDVNVQAAHSRAANITEQARQEAAQITAEANRYVADVLGKLNERLNSILGQVQGGIQVAQRDQQAALQAVHAPAPAEVAPPPAEASYAPPAAEVRETRETVDVEVGAPLHRPHHRRT